MRIIVFIVCIILNFSAWASDGCGSSATLLVSSTSCSSTTASVSGATASGVSIPVCSGSTSATALDVWFRFVAAATTHTVTVDPEGTYSGSSNNSYIDPVIALYSSCSSSGFIQCEDDAGGGGGNCNITVSGLNVGSTYYIRVYDWGSAQPTFTGFDICVTHQCSTPAPPTAIDNGGTYCQSSTATYNIGANGSGSANWHWYSGSCGGQQVATGPDMEASLAQPGCTTYYVRTENSCGNSSCLSAQVCVTASVTPSVTITPASATSICAGQTVMFAATPVNGGNNPTYKWYIDGSLVGTGSPYTTPVLNSNCSVYCIMRSNANCTEPDDDAASATTSITVSTPTANASSNSPVCAGAQLSLNASGGSSYAWNGAGYTGPGQNPTVSSINANQSGTYTVTVTDGAGCTATATTNVTVNPLPVAPVINAPSTICSGQQVNISVTNSGSCSNCSYTWNSGQTGMQIPISTGGLYTVTATNSCGTVTASTNSIVTGQAPVQPVVSGSTSFCIGSSTTLTVSNPCIGCTYNWSSGQSNLAIPVSSAGVYTVTAINSCGSATASVSVLQTASQPVPSINGATAICPGSSDTLTIVNVCAGCSYQWSNNASQPFTAVSLAGTYSVTVTGACGTASATQIITSYPVPVVSIAGTSSSIQTGHYDTLTATGGNTYTWSSGQTSASIIVSPTSATTYSVTATDANGCTGTAQFTVSVGTGPTLAPVADFIVSQVSGICPLNVDFFDNSNNTPTSWLWNFYGSCVSPDTSTAQNPENIRYGEPGVFTVKLTVANAHGTDSHISSITVSGNCLCDTGTGIEDIAIKALLISPNPSSGKFSVSMELHEELASELNIYNVLGQQIEKVVLAKGHGLGDTEIDMSNETKGIYILQVKRGEAIIKRRIEIQ